jgi:hypothetical protein
MDKEVWPNNESLAGLNGRRVSAPVGRMCNVVPDEKESSEEKVRLANAFARLGSRHIDTFLTILSFVLVVMKFLREATPCLLAGIPVVATSRQNEVREY